MFTTLEGKGILRTATEEFLLASEYRLDDEMAHEFTRTFRHTYFFGRRYVDSFEGLMKNKHITFETVLRKNAVVQSKLMPRQRTVFVVLTYA